MSKDIRVRFRDLETATSFRVLEVGKDDAEIKDVCERHAIDLNSPNLSILKAEYAFIDEFNKNGCKLPAEEITNAVLKTLNGTPIDIDHNRQINVGHWLEAAREKKVIIAYGCFWKNNFPEEYDKFKQDITDGKSGVSFEAYIDKDMVDAKKYNARNITFCGGALMLRESPAFAKARVLEFSSILGEKKSQEELNMEELAKVADKIAEEAKVAAVVAEVKPPEVEVPKVEVAVETPKVEETPVVATVEVPKVEEVQVIATVEIPKVEETKPIEAKVEETKPVIEAKIEEVKPVETKVEEVATAVPVLPQDAPMTNGVEEDDDSISYAELMELCEKVPAIKEYDMEDVIIGLAEEKEEHLETLNGDMSKVAQIVVDHLKEDEEYYEDGSTEVGLPTTVAIPTEPTQYTKADMEAKDTCIATLSAKLAEADVIVGKYNEYLKAEMAKKEKD